MFLTRFMGSLDDNDKVLLTMTLTTLAVVVTFIPLRWMQGEYRLVMTNAITMMGMCIVLVIMALGKLNIARSLFAAFIGTMMIVIVIYNGPFQLNWVFAGMAMLYFTMRAVPALLYTESIGIVIAVLLWDEVDIQRWLQDLAALNITMMLIFYGSLTKQRYNAKLQKIASDSTRQATVDALTQLKNRRAFDVRIDSVINTLNKAHHNAALIYIDIDHFKAINDRYGHSVGDDALRLTASLIKESLRENDAYRLGGEEFAGLLTTADQADALTCAERVRSHIEKRFHYPVTEEGKTTTSDLSATVSIGVAMFEKGETASTWIEKADSALYLAKNAGRNRVELYQSTRC